MRGNKKIIALATIFALSLGSVSNVSAVSYGTENNNAAVVEYSQVFSDVPKSHWAFSYVAEMYGRKVVNGFPDGNFYPSSTVTRAEFAKMMTTAAGIDVRNLGVITGFSDVPTTHWATQYIAAAKSYLSSYKNSNGTSSFRPDTAAVREDIAVAMVKLKGIDASGSDESVLKTMFSDYSSISSGARKYIAAAIENGIVSGYEDGTFKAQASITRAEAVAMMWRAFQYGSDSKQWEDDDKKQDSDVTMNQPIPPTFANKNDDNKKDDDDFNQPAAPTVSMGKQDKDDEDFNQPAIPTISMGGNKQDKDEDKSEKPVEKEPEENSDVYYVDTLDATFSGSRAKYLRQNRIIDKEEKV